MDKPNKIWNFSDEGWQETSERNKILFIQAEREHEPEIMNIVFRYCYFTEEQLRTLAYDENSCVRTAARQALRRLLK